MHASEPRFQCPWVVSLLDLADKMNSAQKDLISSVVVPFVLQSRRNRVPCTLNVVPLRPLVRFLDAWLQTPRHSRWLLRTLRLGYAIQFARHPPKFSGIVWGALAELEPEGSEPGPSQVSLQNTYPKTLFFFSKARYIRFPFFEVKYCT